MGKHDDLPDISPFARVMRDKARPSKKIEFPGLDGTPCRLWNPSDGEIDEADVAARKYLTEECKLDALQLSLAIESKLYEAENQRQLLALVVRDVGDPEGTAFATVDDFREWLTPRQREVLMRHLKTYIEERSPERKVGGDENLVGLIRSLKADGVLSDWLIGCDGDSARTIVLSLAEAWPTPTAPNSSAT